MLEWVVGQSGGGWGVRMVVGQSGGGWGVRMGGGGCTNIGPVLRRTGVTFSNNYLKINYHSLF